MISDPVDPVGIVDRGFPLVGIIVLAVKMFPVLDMWVVLQSWYSFVSSLFNWQVICLFMKK